MHCFVSPLLFARLTPLVLSQPVRAFVFFLEQLGVGEELLLRRRVKWMPNP
jgi:hypothetical protein